MPPPSSSRDLRIPGFIIGYLLSTPRVGRTVARWETKKRKARNTGCAQACGPSPVSHVNRDHALWPLVQLWDGEKNEANEPVGFGKATYTNADCYEGSAFNHVFPDALFLGDQRM